MIKENIYSEKKYLLTEYIPLCPDGICNINLLTESEKKLRADGDMLLTGVISVADVVNGNNRIYPKNVLEKELENYQKLIREKRAVGCLDHSDVAIVEYKDVSHLVLRAWWNDNNIMGVLKVLDTPCGKTLRALIEGGVQVGVSSRALGSLSESPKGTVVNEDLQIICWDVVQDSSAPGAYLHLMESKNVVIDKKIYTKADKIYRALNMVLE